MWCVWVLTRSNFTSSSVTGMTGRLRIAGLFVTLTPLWLQTTHGVTSYSILWQQGRIIDLFPCSILNVFTILDIITFLVSGNRGWDGCKCRYGSPRQTRQTSTKIDRQRSDDEANSLNKARQNDEVKNKSKDKTRINKHRTTAWSQER